ncbi:MAG TPA: hypothetical protein VIG33_13310 [Pseudobdellovibrionaceae bacterium]|jgi:hypothetical protein
MNIFKYFIIALTLFLGATSQADSAAIHGMVLFGKSTTYASHLPMFHSPHDGQVIMKISLSDFPRCKTVLLYQKLSAAATDKIFTLLPEALDLAQVMNGEMTQFTASIYEGHFEKSGKLLGMVIVKVEKLILSAKLDSLAPEQNQYLIFGERGEYFAAHIINGRPSYDSILEVKAPYRIKTGLCRLRYCPGLDEMTPVNDDQLPQAVPYVGGDLLGSPGGTLAFINKSIYFEKEELAD